MPISIGGGEVRFGRLRVVFEMSPVWDKMAAEFADVATDILEEEMKGIAREMGKGMLQNIRRFAPLGPTKRLADTQRTWRYWIGRPPGTGGTTGVGWYVTVGLHQPADVSPEIGRPVSFYAYPVQVRSKPSYPLGKLARQRIKSWAASKGISATSAHHIARAIYLRGTMPHPYFEPAALATRGAAEGWLEDGGRDWRDRVETHFAG